MTHDKDKILIRAKDITMILSIVTLIGLVLSPVKKIFRFEEAVEKIEVMESRLHEHDKSIAVINSQYTDIQKQLEQMNWQLRRMRNDGR